ncbi:hypothetical protein K458DRAFT_385674 [Lentithecium fluviatile CBS 122367]|uniref:Uncharacterized protein n=1 Tax=Lentithecium fluviatile CBS 122367 TaxID=1168545 RepID=A0A6G1JC12_9PLEO|nr:hypothetical protein K458DRAFT_385674 [Lentithecium fluviatile CBS 122367]
MLPKLLSLVLLFAALIYDARATPLSTPISLSVPSVSIHRERSTSDEELTAWTVRCGYAISGMFCATQRLTVYIIAICIFCFRFHEWLTAVGTAYLVTYTVTTAIYGIALAADPAVGSDADFVRIGRLLTISVFMTFLFVRFAPHIFKNNVKSTLMLWVGITLLAWIIVAARENAFWSQFYRVRGVEVCNSAGLCVDTCSTVMPASKFRGPSDEVMSIQKTKRQLAIPANGSLSINEFLGVAVNFTATLPSLGYNSKHSFDPGFIPFLVAWLLAFVNWIIPPREIRNNLFQAIVKKNTANEYAKRMSHSTISKGPATKQPRQNGAAHSSSRGSWSILSVRVQTAKALATFCYIFTTLAMLVFPGIFVWSIFQGESGFRSSIFIEQEGPRNVGQWGPCVGVALAAVAALFDRLSSRAGNQIDIWALQEVQRPPDAERPRWLFGWEEGWLWYVINREEWKNFVAWWKDPIRVCWPSVMSS